MKIGILTVSDRAYRGEYRDESGPEAARLIGDEFPQAQLSVEVVPDESPAIRAALDRWADCDVVVTTGGTGLSPRDITPDVTSEWCERLLPGVAEVLRAESYRETPHAMLSRGVAGVRGRCVVVNLPGSVNAVKLCVPLLFPLISHAPRMLRGEGH